MTPVDAAILIGLGALGALAAAGLAARPEPRRIPVRADERPPRPRRTED
ncbi:hypothetical protein ACQ5SO_06145 [Rhodovulum sp. DZ06]